MKGLQKHFTKEDLRHFCKFFEYLLFFSKLNYNLYLKMTLNTSPVHNQKGTPIKIANAQILNHLLFYV